MGDTTNVTCFFWLQNSCEHEVTSSTLCSGHICSDAGEPTHIRGGLPTCLPSRLMSGIRVPLEAIGVTPMSPRRPKGPPYCRQLQLWVLVPCILLLLPQLWAPGEGPCFCRTPSPLRPGAVRRWLAWVLVILTGSRLLLLPHATSILPPTANSQRLSRPPRPQRAGHRNKTFCKSTHIHTCDTCSPVSKCVNLDIPRDPGHMK